MSSEVDHKVKIRPVDPEAARLLEEPAPEPLPADMALEFLRDAFAEAESERVDAEYAAIDDEDDDEHSVSKRLAADAYVQRRA
jgi:hypothetical protein